MFFTIYKSVQRQFLSRKVFVFDLLDNGWQLVLKDILNMLSLRAIEGLKNKFWQIDFWRRTNYFSYNLVGLGWSFDYNSPKNGAGANWEAVKLLREHFLTSYWYLVFGIWTFPGNEWCTSYPKMLEVPIWEFRWNIYNPTFHPFLWTFELKIPHTGDTNSLDRCG